jgi:hypothetical protein
MANSKRFHDSELPLIIQGTIASLRNFTSLEEVNYPALPGKS